MQINDIQNQLVEEFEMMEEWTDKYDYIIQLGKELPPMDESLKTDDRLIKGCQARVWLDAKADEKGILHLQADSDAIITKGLIAMLVRVLNNQPAQAIAQAELFFVDKIGLRSHLSSTRSNGLSSMIQQVKLLAVNFVSAASAHE